MNKRNLILLQTQITKEKQMAFAETLLSRDEVIAEAVNRMKGGDIGETFEDTCWVMGCIREVMEDPADTIHHIIPENILNNENELSDYIYLMAQEVQQQIN